MRSSKKKVIERRNKILEIINRLGEASVEEISEYLKVSDLTIRRDLQYLEDEGLLERYHGGAKAVKKKIAAMSGEDEIRLEIAQKAARLIEDNDTIFINTAQIALDIIPYISAKNVLVITNNGNVINVQHSMDVSIVLTGGELRHVKGTMVGEFALDSVNKVIATKAFIGCAGISAEVGMTSDILNEVKINEAMFKRTKEHSYILAEPCRFGKVSNFVSVPIDLITDIITSKDIDDELTEPFIEKGIKIIK